jgi:hypothetical protein
MRPSAPVLFILFLTAGSACARTGDGAAGYSFQVYEEDGFTVAATTNGPKYDSPLFTYEEVTRIQEDESIEGSLLAHPRWMGIDERGMVYVCDGVSTFEESRLVVFDRKGQFHHLIGRMGDGPGEYRDPTLLSIADGVVTIYERGFRRISWFRLDGEFLRLRTLDPQMALPENVYISPAGSQILIHRESESGWSSRTATILSSAGDRLATIETTRVKWYYGLETSSWRLATPPRFCGQAQLLFFPDRGILRSTGQEPIIEWFDLAGQKHAEYRLGLQPGPVT